MASPNQLQRSWDKGVKRDFARNALPPNTAWNAVDLIPNLGAPLRERGGWTNASNDIAAVTATASYVIGGLNAPFLAGTKLLAIDEDGRLYSIASNGTVTDIGAAVAVSQNPVFHRDKAIIPAAGGSTAPKYYDGSTLGNLGGSPPNAVYATVSTDRTVLGRTSANPNRIWFSDPGDPAGWDTTNVYWDFNDPVTGMAALRSAILVFHDSTISRLRGTTPPPDTDMISDDPMFNVGCTDARSIVTFGDRVIFANPEGIFITDGSAEPASLTDLCGMTTYWQELLSGYTTASWTLTAGVLRGYYFICVMDGTTFKDAAMIDMRRESWWRLSNVDARAMWGAEGAADELYFGRRGAARVGKLSPIFMPSSTVKNDGDGDAVAAVFESPFYEGKQGEKGWRRLYVGMELTDYASDNPTVAVSYVKTPEETSYTALTGSLAESTTRTTRKKDLGFAADGVAFKLTRANAGDFLLYSLEAEVQAREASRRAA